MKNFNLCTKSKNKRALGRSVRNVRDMDNLEEVDIPNIGVRYFYTSNDTDGDVSNKIQFNYVYDDVCKDCDEDDEQTCKNCREILDTINSYCCAEECNCYAGEGGIKKKCMLRRLLKTLCIVGVVTGVVYLVKGLFSKD